MSACVSYRPFRPGKPRANLILSGGFDRLLGGIFLLEWLLLQSEYILRIVVAALCGLAIGYERQNRLKTAGIRTHIIVAIAASLMMLTSKYGFYDLLGKDGIGLDPSRIAAGVVTAIGFLGAGVIFVHNQTVSGLTTAAGVWATVGIGTAIGSGMYFVGVTTTVMIVVLQILLHKNSTLIKTPLSEKITLQVAGGESREILPALLAKFKKNHIEIVSLKASRTDSSAIRVNLDVRFPESYDISDVLLFLEEDPNIRSIEM